MTLPDRDLGYLEDIRKFAARALSYTHDVTYEEFLANTGKQDAVVRLMVIGEVAGRLSDDARSELAEFDWDAMTGMRHRIVHDRVDLEKVWDVVRHHLAPLNARLSDYLGGVE